MNRPGHGRLAGPPIADFTEPPAPVVGDAGVPGAEAGRCHRTAGMLDTAAGNAMSGGMLPVCGGGW